MFATFYSIFMALFSGTWTAYTTEQASAALSAAWADLISLLTNALGGAFTEKQTLAMSAEPQAVWACVLSIVALTGLAWLVWKLTKYIFAIFFGGWNR